MSEIPEGVEVLIIMTAAILAVPVTMLLIAFCIKLLCPKPSKWQLVELCPECGERVSRFAKHCEECGMTPNPPYDYLQSKKTARRKIRRGLFSWEWEYRKPPKT
jgi:predicted amidophosphoribosyltransferase